jgi:hypothetical protein
MTMLPVSSSLSRPQNSPPPQSIYQLRDESLDFPDDEVVVHHGSKIVAPRTSTKALMLTSVSSEPPTRISNEKVARSDNNEVLSRQQITLKLDSYSRDEGSNSNHRIDPNGIDLQDSLKSVLVIVNLEREDPPSADEENKNKKKTSILSIVQDMESRDVPVSTTTVTGNIIERGQETFEDRRVALDAEGLYVTMRTTQPIDPPPSFSSSVSQNCMSVCSESNVSDIKRDVIIEECNDVDNGTEVIHAGKPTTIISTSPVYDKDKNKTSREIAEKPASIGDKNGSIKKYNNSTNSSITKNRDDRPFHSKNLSVGTDFTVSSVFQAVQGSIFSMLTPSSAATISTVDVFHRRDGCENIPRIVVHPTQTTVADCGTTLSNSHQSKTTLGS